MKLLWCSTLFFFTFLLVFPTGSYGFEKYNRIKTYDGYFKKYSKRFFGPGFDWHFFKSQAIAESGLMPEARSQVGAVGLMQIMPATYKEILKKNPYIKGSRNHPRWNIAAGIFYDRRLWKMWKAKRPFRDRINFTFAAFNAGAGNILKAQEAAKKRGLNPNLWPSILIGLPQVTGKHSKETINYVKKINQVKEVLR